MPAAAPQVRPAARPGPVQPVASAPRHLQVVDEPDRSLRTLPTFVLSITLAFAIAFAVVACQVLLVQGQERLDTLDSSIDAGRGRHQELRLEVAELESPERIVAAATELGMVTPPEVLYLTPAPRQVVADDGPDGGEEPRG